MEFDNKSFYDPDRETVGKIYRDLQIKGTTDKIQVGDMTNELMSSLVQDLNDTINSKPYGERDYYITVAEKKDMMMPRAIHRQIRTTLFRPYPEDDTLVFRTQHGDVKFCWCLPHYSEMDNMLSNENLYDYDMLQEIKHWKKMRLEHFGFMKDEMGNWIANPKYQDKPLKEYLGASLKIII